jgi:NAD(P)-dependent dehydrogenase (short-subunit alcohol dehydrogenase family)
VSTICITGSAGGIGLATRTRLERDGHRVIGVDVRDAEVIADLAMPTGRAAMVDDVTRACDGVLDGLVAGAGLMGQGPVVVAVDYFGAVATLEGLRPLLARGENASAVAISSNSASVTPGIPPELVDVLLAGDEPAALAAFGDKNFHAYMASKLALAHWVRRHAVRPEWIGAGIRCNAVAPGLIETPMTAGDLDAILHLGELFPIPIGRAGRPEEIANVLVFLLSPEASLFCGSVVYVDGGSDAALRADDFPSPHP